MDIVQTAAARVLGYIPTFIPENGRQFHRLLRRIVVNDILNRLRSPNVGCREPSRESFGDSVLDLRGPNPASNGPVRALLTSERLEELRAWARVALEFLRDPLERRLMLLAAVEEWSWKEIGNDLHLAPDAARMRFQRLLPRLANHIRLLGEGRIPLPSSRIVLRRGHQGHVRRSRRVVSRAAGAGDLCPGLAVE